MSSIPDKLRTQITQLDQNHCAYCQTSQANSGIPLTCDHILPRVQGGLTILENLRHIQVWYRRLCKDQAQYHSGITGRLLTAAA
ncbi:MAG: HNH endonuclease signature motif containing protein [Cyanobacteriota bacterium]|nr:HNH endonuclease signature motif containing protein [Cyanobacteriota bacterium]